MITRQLGVFKRQDQTKCEKTTCLSSDIYLLHMRAWGRVKVICDTDSAFAEEAKEDFSVYIQTLMSLALSHFM